jgi:hypothetical protein
VPIFIYPEVNLLSKSTFYMIPCAVPKNVLLIGSTSNYSRALQNFLKKKDYYFDIISSEDIRIWNSEKNFAKIQRKLEDEFSKRQYDILIYTSGVTDPDVNSEVFKFLNITLPLFINKTFSVSKTILVFPGAAMENFPQYCTNSKYLNSKLEFSRSLEESDSRWVNLRFNQWYGTMHLRPHLFLGAAISSIKTQKNFCMGSGLQFREFHHIEDDLGVIPIIDDKFIHRHVNVSSGNSIQLKDFAINLFSRFKLDHLLMIGCRKDSTFENSSVVLPANPMLTSLNFRDSLPGVIEFIENMA